MPAFEITFSQEKAKEKKQTLSKKEEGTVKKKLTAMETQTDDISRISHASKIVERMVNQNTFDDVSQGEISSLVV